MEYEQAPSGFVTLYNYKEPFMDYKGGYGYMGVLLFDGESDKVQCHLCGEWYIALGNHLHKEHAMRAIEYKQEVGLNKKTALIGENMRAKLIKSGLERRLKNLQSRKGKVVSEEVKQKISNTLKENRFEKMNTVGTCPAQLIDRLQKLYNKLGRTPKMSEIGFEQALKLTYGSMEEACRVAGIPYRKEGKTVDNPRWIKKEQVLHFMSSFLKREGKFPSRKDFIREGVRGYWDTFIVANKNNYNQLKPEAMKLTGEYIATGKKIKHTKENLIWYLQNFEKVHGRKPAISDIKRKLLPSAGAYYYHFNNWKGALKAAFGE